MAYDDILDTTRDITASEINSYLYGLRFPVSKSDIVTYALKMRADTQIVDVLQAIPEDIYYTYDEVDYAIGRVLY